MEIPIGSTIAYSGLIMDYKKLKKDNGANRFHGTAIEALGWMTCDGRSLEIQLYPTLFAALGFLYTTNDSKTKGTHFNIPDYRGYFLRMVNTKKDDSSLELRKPINAENDKLEIATKQEDAIQQHKHKYGTIEKTPDGSTKPLILGGDKVPFYRKEETEQSVIQKDDDDTSYKTSGRFSEKETRPKNMSVYYIIRYR